MSELDDLICATKNKYNDLIASASDGTFLYGAGFIGKWAVSYLEGIGIPILGFVDSDSNKWGKVINGKKIFSPFDNCIINSKSIVITSRHAVRSVKNSLIDLPAVIMSVDALVVHRYDELGVIEKVRDFFNHDVQSLNTYDAILNSMLLGTTEPLLPIADSRPFFDKFGFFNRDQEIFVDAGAYVGDSLERFIWSVNGVFRQVHAFEPGLAQFQALKKRVERLSQEWALITENIFLVNKGLSSKNRQAMIEYADNLIQMSVTKNVCLPDDTRAGRIELVSLDSYFDGQKFTLLKVDVEGSERELIQGARESIAAYKPRIALSVYHYPTDIFELPLQLKEINKSYSFTLGHHSSQLMDTVLYARDRND